MLKILCSYEHIVNFVVLYFVNLSHKSTVLYYNRYCRVIYIRYNKLCIIRDIIYIKCTPLKLVRTTVQLSINQ